MRRLALLGLTVALVSGCGSDDDEPKSQPKSDDQKIEEVVVAYNTAVADGDVKACDLLTAEGQQIMVDNGFTGEAGRASGDPAQDCPPAVEHLRGALEAEQEAGIDLERPNLDDLKFAAVENVQVRGAQARADVKAKSKAYTVDLEKVGDEWKLSSLPGLKPFE